MRRNSTGRRSPFSTDSGNASWTENSREISSRRYDGALVRKNRLPPANLRSPEQAGGDMKNRTVHKHVPENGLASPVDSGCSADVTADADTHKATTTLRASDDKLPHPRQAHTPNQARRRSLSGLGLKNHATAMKKGRGKNGGGGGGDLAAYTGVDPNDKAFIRRAHTNLTIALRAGRSTQQQQQQHATPPTNRMSNEGGGGSGNAAAAKRNSRRRSIDCPYQIWKISADKSTYGFVPMVGSAPTSHQPYGRYNKSVVDPQLTSSAGPQDQQRNSNSSSSKPAQERVAFPPLTSLPSTRSTGQLDNTKYNNKHRQRRPTSYGDGHDRGRRQSSTTLVPSHLTTGVAKNRRSTSMDHSNKKHPSSNKRLASLLSRRNGDDPLRYHDVNEPLSRLQRKDRNKSRSSSIPRASPLSTASAERCKKAAKPVNYRTSRRASMPVVCVNGMNVDESVGRSLEFSAHRRLDNGDNNGISFSSRKQDPLLPARNQLSPNGLYRKNTTAVSCSTEDYSLPRAEEKLLRTSNTKIVRHPNEVTTPRNEDGIETRFETILEISPNEAIHHFVSGMPDRPPPIISENMKPIDGSITDGLTQENLGGGEDEEDEEQEEQYRYQRIIDWLEEVQTGEKAEQCVHDVIKEDDTVSPEFARANAIVVVYDEAKTEQTANAV